MKVFIGRAMHFLAIALLASAAFVPAGEPVPTATIEAMTDRIAENSTDAAVFTIMLDVPAAADVTISYAVGGTATPGEDYVALPGALTIPAGETYRTILVMPIDDYSFESDETVTVSLLTGTGYSVGDPSVAIVTIVEDDPTHGAGQVRPVAHHGRIIIVAGNPARDRLKARFELHEMPLPFDAGREDDKETFEGFLRLGQKETARDFPFVVDGRGICRSKDYLRIRINPRNNRVRAAISLTNLRSSLGISLDEDIGNRILEVPVTLDVGGYSGRGTLLFLLTVRGNTFAKAKY